MLQLISFNASKGGNVPLECLNNVREGYGIDNKYESAWVAWQHTQQHPDRNIPTGLAVPLFYSYTATIEGITKNYGHINVQLPDGTIWSDGNIYPSLDFYVANHTPKFVGWGESINDFKIIGEDNMNLPNVGDLQNITNRNGWQKGSDGKTTPAAIAKWTTGTDNLEWPHPENDKTPNDVWVALTIELEEYGESIAKPGKFKPYSGNPLFVEG